MKPRRGRPPTGKSPATAARDRLVMERHRAGRRHTDIAAYFGISVGRVSQIVAEHKRRSAATPGCCHFNPEAGAYC